ncbi:Detected protein of unknown function [Hibiscus syriacus]|uniref:GDSL esterase/lipase n=1 Tax=Hibiscus syriacus TaxID=106335 RepID=A0A6A2X3L9_HIBSY|nr:Detected protein of unknown function [Hibiscus syriacus]
MATILGSTKHQPLWLLLLVFLLILSNAEPQVPCYFIFGDSLSDVGIRLTGSIFLKDQPEVQLLDFEEFIPPFATSRGQDILKGVNYASGSAGILNESGQQVGDRISMNKQLSNHQTIISTMAEMLRECSASKLLRKCIYAVQIGSNDYINNYFMPQYYNTSRLFTPHQYAAYLIQQYSRQIKGVLQVQAHRMEQMAVCVEKLNRAAHLFNRRLLSLVNELNSNLTDAKFTHLNPSGTSFANSLGFTVANVSFCKIGSYGSLCVPGSKPCEDRSRYVFWDAVHPSDAWNEATATQAYGSTAEEQPRCRWRHL